MAKTTFEELLDAGVHFGHLKRKWNPNMAPYIFMERNGIHILDLYKTMAKLEEAASAIKQVAKSGKKTATALYRSRQIIVWPASQITQTPVRLPLRSRHPTLSSSGFPMYPPAARYPWSTTRRTTQEVCVRAIRRFLNALPRTVS